MTQELEQGDAMQSPLDPGVSGNEPEKQAENGIDKSHHQPSIETATEITGEAQETEEQEFTVPAKAQHAEMQANGRKKKSTEQPDHQEPEQQEVSAENAEPIEHADHAEETDDVSVAEPVENYLVYGKEELVKMLDDLLKEQDFIAARNKVSAIKEAFQTILSHERNEAMAQGEDEGAEKEEHEKPHDPLADKFFALLKKFNRRRIELREKQESEKNENLKAKSEILTEFKNLIQYEENMQKAFNRFHELQAKWRAIGPTPQQNVNDLWLTYKLYVDKFYELIRINKELQELDFRKNLAAKIKICERAEELILEPSINKALNHMQSLQNQFRETGPVPRDNKNEIWERFKAASDKIFERKHQYLGEQKEKYDKNLADKNILCEKAEELSKGTYLKSSEWQEKIKELLSLQAEWKKTGFAGKEENDKVWSRFKSAFDHFFHNKKEYYSKAKEEFNTHLQKKTELCLHAEALKDSTDWKNTTNELKRLQQEWKTIGSAGEYQERKIFNRFRKACDVFFENKSKHFASQDQQQEENYSKKLALIEEIEKFTAGDNHFESIETLKDFQKQWMELGLVPLPKKEEINTRYKKAIDQQFSNLRIDDATRSKSRHIQKFDNSYRPKAGTGNDKMDHEKRALVNKINALKSDVSLWENNIGFFAKSKNADVLKKEFEEKINKAKEEIKSLHEKMELVKKS